MHVALIRGINVGKAKQVAMADLRALVEKLGYSEACTLLNSGNVVRRSASSVPVKWAKCWSVPNRAPSSTSEEN